LSFPTFYDPQRVGQLVIPRTAQAIAEGQQAGLLPADDDRLRVLLLLVDPQVDFIHTDGALSVPGAVDDTRRTVEWIYRNAGRITAIAASLDSHVPAQIFYPTWWIDSEGQHPAPFTVITSAEAEAGRWKPLYEPEWSQEYLEKLEEQAKKQLMIWPYHTMIGTPGHAITPTLYEAIVYHAAARRKAPVFLSKGSIPKTEHYSILEPEVKVGDHPLGHLNTAFLEMLATHNLIYVAGQAKSHCVLETVNSMMRYFQRQPDVIGKLRVLMDCTSSVAHPEIDFEALATEAFDRFAGHGLRQVVSGDPIG
jgi:nicotinamidase-related amidase